MPGTAGLGSLPQHSPAFDLLLELLQITIPIQEVVYPGHHHILGVHRHHVAGLLGDCGRVWGGCVSAEPCTCNLSPAPVTLSAVSGVSLASLVLSSCLSVYRKPRISLSGAASVLRDRRCVCHVLPGSVKHVLGKGYSRQHGGRILANTRPCSF